MWFLFMCWEVYDLHPDHMIFYSVLFLGPVVYRTSYSVRHPAHSRQRTP